jgi:hypothetical protein
MLSQGFPVQCDKCAAQVLEALAIVGIGDSRAWSIRGREAAGLLRPTVALSDQKVGMDNN